MYEVPIGDEVFYLPKEVSYKQYYKINTLFSEIAVKSADFADLDSSDGLAITFKVGVVLKRLFDSGKIPVFFAVILVPKGENRWREEFMAEEKLEVFEDLTDTQMFGVIESFLAGRGVLIGNIMTSLESWMKKNKLSIPKLEKEILEAVEK